MEWCSTTAVLCNHRINEHPRPKVYHRVVWHIAFLPATKGNERHTALIKTKKLSGISGVQAMITCYMKISAIHIGPIVKKIKKEAPSMVICVDKNSLA